MSWSKVSRNCLICGENDFKFLGIRGTREFTGADPRAEPHIVTNVVRCRNCDFVYTNPEIHGVENWETDYYKDPGAYQAAITGEFMNMYSKRLKMISKYKKAGNLLDVGSGKGEFISIASNAGWSVIGVEPSKEFCEYARATYNVETIQGYLDDNLNIPKSNFDLITLHHVLEHINEPAAQLVTISNYLKPDGIIFIEVPNANSTFLKLIDSYFKLKGLKWSSRLSPLHPPYHKYGYSKRSLMFLLNRCNYETLSVKTYSGRERGYINYEDKSFNFVSWFRRVASSIFNIMGNREMLCLVAKPIEQ